jgi:hypothetical protein
MYLIGAPGHFQSVDLVAMGMEKGDAEVAGRATHSQNKQTRNVTQQEKSEARRDQGSTNQEWPPGLRLYPHATHHSIYTASAKKMTTRHGIYANLNDGCRDAKVHFKRFKLLCLCLAVPKNIFTAHILRFPHHMIIYARCLMDLSEIHPCCRRCQ